MNFVNKRESGKSFLNFLLLTLIIAVGIFICYNYFFAGTKSNNSTDLAQYEQDYPDYKKYYYSQLNADGKFIYYTIINNIDTIKEGNQIIRIDLNSPNGSDAFQNAWDAITLDKPELFYIDSNGLVLETHSTGNLLGQTSYFYYLKPNSNSSTYLHKPWSSKLDVDQAISQVENIANEIVSNAKKYNKRYDQIKYIHDYIVTNVSYDSEKENNDNIYGTLLNNKALCSGYSNTFKYLLDKLNIPNVIAYGKGLKENGRTENHSWNYVQMNDGKWYAVDCTWDDPIVIGGGTLPAKYRYMYFLKGSDTFFQSHEEDNHVSSDEKTNSITSTFFTYPTLSTTDY